MKTGIFCIAVVSLLQLAVSQPHRKGQHAHGKRQAVITDVATDVAYTTMDAEDVIVYVDVHGKPISTSTVYHKGAGPTASPSSSPASASESTPTAAPQESHIPHAAAPPPPPSSKQPAPALANSLSSPPPPPSSYQAPTKPLPPPPASSPPAHSSSPPPKPSSPPGFPPGPPGSGGPGFASGISYSPYNTDNSCKSSSQVATDLQGITGYEVIRLYGTDCKQVENVLAAIKGKSVKLFVGIFDIADIPSQAKTIISAVNGDWGLINAVSVGNELVNQGKASVGQVVAAISQAKSTLKGAGYSGPVVTVDTMTAMKANPELCTASDFCAINCHAFFDGNVLPENAGAFVQKWAQDVSKAADGKTVVITETGWPTQGDTNNKAVPSKENQAAAMKSIKSSFSSNAILFNAYNDLWKKDSGSTFGAEKFWGLLGDAPA